MQDASENSTISAKSRTVFPNHLESVFHFCQPIIPTIQAKFTTIDVIHEDRVKILNLFHLKDNVHNSCGTNPEFPTFFSLLNEFMASECCKQAIKWNGVAMATVN